MASLKDYTTICNSAPSEFLAEVAMRHRTKLAERNLNIIKHSLTIVDDLFTRHSSLFTWTRPQAGSMGFPRLLQGDSEDFCDKLVKQAGVLLLPGTMYDESNNHFRLGLGRKNLPQAVERLEAYLSKISDFGG
jgi:aspartate/methionine/tyrosine aminotransferase